MMKRWAALWHQDRPAAWSLVLINIMPLIGVLFLGWNTGSLLILYWAENIVVGAFNVLKLITLRTDNWVEKAQSVVMIPFFIVHYGGFTLAHGIFVFVLASKFSTGHFDTTLWREGGGVSQEAWDLVTPWLWASFAIMWISHGVSFFTNYLGKGENRNVTPNKLMFEPYKRVVVLHLTILLGASAALVLGQPIGLLIVMVCLKTAVDLRLHWAEHLRAGQARGGSALPADGNP